MKNFIRSIIPFFARIIPSGKLDPVTYWRHREKKHLYLCMSEKYITDDENSTGEQKFLELFKKAIRISKTEFDSILYFFPEMQIVTVADDNIFAMIVEENPETKDFYPLGVKEKDIDGNYAEDEHEESEDKKL